MRFSGSLVTSTFTRATCDDSQKNTGKVMELNSCCWHFISSICVCVQNNPTAIERCFDIMTYLFLSFSPLAVLQSKEKIDTPCYRFKTKHESYIVLKSQWSSFTNPWTKEVEFIVSLNEVVSWVTICNNSLHNACIFFFFQFSPCYCVWLVHAENLSAGTSFYQ